jgi:NAD+ diphosphatase
MQFIPEFKSPSIGRSSALWFVFNKGRLLIKVKQDSCRIPKTSDLEALNISPRRIQYLGALDERPCYAAELAASGLAAADFEFKELRSLFGWIEDDLVWIAGRANQLVYWSQTHLYCGRCGHRTEDKMDERAKICPQCGLINYPRVSPAIIVAVFKDHQILLARNERFKLPFYSVLAGFVEPGETLEECVKREILEEVGITVKNIRYFGNQPWPFPNSLMIAFVADYAAGRITIDGSEIVDAAWFAKDELPQIPPKISIARQLIDWFTNTH